MSSLDDLEKPTANPILEDTMLIVPGESVWSR